MNLEQRIDANPRFSSLLFAGLSAILFHPFFLGKFVVGGTDVLYAHYPNILFGYREFWQFGNFSLWNRYIFCGVDFTGSMHAHFLNPLYWPLLLFPERYIFHALTAGFMVMNALTGWFWCRISARLGVSGTGSLLVGVVAQAGMFFWFAMTTMIAVPMYLCASIAIYLVLSRDARGGLANYLALSPVLGFLFVTPHPTYILGFFLPVVIVFLASGYPNWLRRPWHDYTPVFVASCVTALLLSLYRIAPVALAIAGEGEFAGDIWLPQYVNHAYFGLTAFNPLALGISLHDSQVIAQALNLGAGRHIQAHNALYFGVAPVVMTYVAIRTGASTRTVLLATACIVPQLAYLFALQPLSDIVYLVLYPLGHEGLFRSASNIAFLFLLIDCLKVLAAAEPSFIRRASREWIVIAGLLIVAWLAMYAKVLHEMPNELGGTGNQVLVNTARLSILATIIATVAITWRPASIFGRLRFGLLAVTMGALVVIVSTAAAVGGQLLPGDEAATEALRNGLIVILACFAVLLAWVEPTKTRVKLALAFGTVAAVLVLVPLPFASAERHLISSLWSGAVGWGTFIALLAATLALFARLASGDMGTGLAMRLMLVLTVVDLAIAFGNYSYVNIPKPFIRHIEDIYPSSSLLESIKMAIDPKSESDRRNLLVNPELRLVSGDLTGWRLGGDHMALCPRQPPSSLSTEEGGVHLCYPGNDANGNLYQDVSTPAHIRQVAFGAWVLADPGMEVRLFLTSPSHNIGGQIVKHKGDGKWHWVQTTLKAKETLKTVRSHINLPKSGHIGIYAPRLVYGTVVQPEQRPTDDQHEVAELRGDFPREVDLASYRVNRVHLMNGFANELMTNFAIVSGTPTYAGIDSDLPAAYAAFLRAFRLPDPSWYHRAGLYSSLDDERLLDLLGVRYDVAPNGQVVSRPNAIPRLAAFSSFEIAPDRARALERLKAPDFDHTTTILLQDHPAELYSPSITRQLLKLPYQAPEADRLKLHISTDNPRLILFNDRFSAGWKAYWNGEPLQVLPANVAFMAVVVPPGEGELTFAFQPLLFLTLAKVSAATAILMILIGVIRFVRVSRVTLRVPKR